MLVRFWVGLAHSSRGGAHQRRRERWRLGLGRVLGSGNTTKGAPRVNKKTTHILKLERGLRLRLGELILNQWGGHTRRGVRFSRRRVS